MTRVRRRERSLSPSDPRLGAWRAFLVAHARLTRRLDDELRTEHALSLAEYDALLQLAEAPGRRLRMSQLADRVLLSRSGITRLVDRLEAHDLVVRSSCATDARGSEAILTEAGRARLRAAAITHLRGIERYFIAGGAAPELEALERSLSRLAGRVDAEVGSLTDPEEADAGQQ